MSQVVDPELQFEAVFRPGFYLGLLDARVVDEAVEARFGGNEIGGERADGRNRGQVQMLVNNLPKRGHEERFLENEFHSFNFTPLQRG